MTISPQASRSGSTTLLGGSPLQPGRGRPFATGAAMAAARRARGQTLFELAMVLSIITIIAAIAAPRFSGADQRYRADAAARRIAADLEYVSRTARSQAASQSISFSVTSDSYTSSARPLDTAPDQTYVVRLDVGPYRAAVTTVDFEGTTEIIFNGHGMPDRGGYVDITVGSVSRRVTITAGSGEVVIE